MTVQTEENTIKYNGDGVTASFAFNFQVTDPNWITVFEDDAETLLNFETVINANQNDNPGGFVNYLDAPPAGVPAEGVVITIARIVPLDQQLDYTSFDPFPAESHESGLDKLTFIDQQHEERIESSLRFPVGDEASVELPGVEVRAEKFLFFDLDGNAAVSEIEDSEFALLAISILADSQLFMRVDSSQDAQRPQIGGNNINGPNGILQLNNQGKVPFANMGISGINLRGPFRGDDLCDKPGDGIGDCSAPDTRNPSERFPDLVPSFPGEPGKYTTGDLFLLTFQDPEVNGTMNLFSSLGQPSAVIGVLPRDGVVFLSGFDAEGEPTPNAPQGWYHIPKLYDVGDANSITYSPDGNFILPAGANNVQIAVDFIDKNALDLQNRNQTVDGIKTFVLPPRTAATPIIDNDLARKGYVDETLDKSLDDVFVGSVQAFAHSNVDARWLFCDGSAVDRTAFDVLFAKIGVIYGNGDGATTFNLPDYRGQFLRGHNSGAGIDPNAGARTDRGDGTTGDQVGTKQAGEIQSHQHPSAGQHNHTATQGTHNHTASSAHENGNLGGRFSHNSRSHISNLTVDAASAGAITIGDNGEHTHPATGDHQHAASGGAETRGKNVYVRWYMFTGLLP